MKAQSETTREIQSVKRAIMILNCFDMHTTELPLQDICESVGLNKSTALGILNTLAKYGYIDKNPKNGRYMLGRELAYKSIMVSNQFSRSLNLAALKYMKLITEKYCVTCYVFAYRDSVLTCLEVLIPNNTSYSAVSTVLGRKMAYHAAASGKVVLAYLDKGPLDKHLNGSTLFAFTEHTIVNPELVRTEASVTRERGYSTEYDEVDEGIGALSVPIFNSHADMVGTLSVSGTTAWIRQIEDEIVRDLKCFSQAISNQLYD